MLIKVTLILKINTLGNLKYTGLSNGVNFKPIEPLFNMLTSGSNTAARKNAMAKRRYNTV